MQEHLSNISEEVADIVEEQLQSTDSVEAKAASVALDEHLSHITEEI